jgi:DNA polymerase
MTERLEIREALAAPDGFLVLAVDASQIECRLLNYVAGQEDVIANFRAGRDPYVAVASQFYGYAVNKKDHPRERQVGKVLELQAGYQSGAAKIQATLRIAGIEITAEEALRARNAYRSTHPYVVALWQAAGEVLTHLHLGYNLRWGPVQVSDHRLWHPNGTMLDYSTLQWHTPTAEEVGEGSEEERWRRAQPHWRWRGRYGWRKIYGGAMVENLIQWLARVVVSQAMLRMRRAGLRIVGTAHDEVWVLVPRDGREEEAKAFCIAEMSREPVWLPGIPLAAEAEMGERYGK